MSYNGNKIISGNADKAIIGGLFFGSTGAIVGRAAERDINEKCNGIYIEIILNRHNNFIIRVPFIAEETDKKSLEYSNAINRAKQMISLLKKIKNNNTKNVHDENTIQLDKFEDVQKYKELLDKDIITSDEYERKKKELLGL